MWLNACNGAEEKRYPAPRGERDHGGAGTSGDGSDHMRSEAHSSCL